MSKLGQRSKAEESFQWLLIHSGFPLGVIKTFYIGFTSVRTLKTMNYIFYFIHIKVLFVYMCVLSVQVCVPEYEYGGHKTSLWSQLCSFHFHVSSGDKFRLQGLGDKHPYPLSHLASPELCILKESTSWYVNYI